MEPLYKSKFTLPQGDYIDTAWIPEMLAKAKVPDDNRPKTVTMFWVPDGGFNFTPTTDGDDALLREIWKELPGPVFPMTLEAWAPYEDAYNKATAKPKRGLRWEVDDPQDNARRKRAAVKIEYQKALVSAITDGSLEVRNKQTGLLVPPPASGYRQLVTTRQSLKDFAERVGAFEVVDGPTPERARESDALDPREESSYLLIIRALLNLANMGTKQRNETKTIMGRLAKLKLRTLERKTIGKVLEKARALK